MDIDPSAHPKNIRVVQYAVLHDIIVVLCTRFQLSHARIQDVL